MAKVRTAPPPQIDWWRRWPGLYDAELAAYSRHGVQPKILAKDKGFLILGVDWPVYGNPVALEVRYAPTHPYSRPRVMAPELDLARHRDPIGGALCLLVQGSGQWAPSQLVADHIAEQLPKLFSALEARAEGRLSDAATIEENAPDPLVPYFDYLAEHTSAVFYSSSLKLPQGEVGVLRLAGRDRPGEAFEAIVQTARPLIGSWLAQPFDLPNPTSLATEFVGRWIRFRPPTLTDAAEILAAAEAAAEAALSLRPNMRAAYDKVSGAKFLITGLVFEDELQYGPDGRGLNWLFLVTRKTANGSNTKLVRGFRIDPDLMARNPVAAHLARRSALVVGVGAIGSFVATDLVRAGLHELHIIDPDVVEPGNTVRWALGREYWGYPKVQALYSFLAQNYPYSIVRGWGLKLGDASAAPNEIAKIQDHPIEFLRERIAAVDVIIDASASTECQHVLASFSRELGKPLVLGYATEGVAGGLVARFRPKQPGCLVCLTEHWLDGSLPEPPKEANSDLTFVGCNAPTFTGASFDLQEVSLEVVRSAVGFLAPDAYDLGDWALSVLSLRNPKRRLPSWEAFDILPHPRCGGCIPP